MQTVVAAFDTRQAAETAVERLAQQGFSRESIHLQAGLDPEAAMTDHDAGVHTGFWGSIEDFFSRLFGDDTAEHAGTYAETVRRGGTVVVVDARSDSDVDKAKRLLDELGAIDVDERAEQWKSTGWTGFDRDAQPLTARQSGSEQKTVMPVVEEKLEVGKRAVEGGGVRVVRRVTETPVSELVRLREERATIERRPVDRPATEADFANFKEGTVEVREMSEEAVVGKTARVVEEVVVGKEVTEREEKVSETLRRTDVEVERVGGERGIAEKAGSGAPGTYGTAGANEDQNRGIAKQREGAARDAQSSVTGAFGEKVEGKAEKVAGKVQEGYGDLKRDVTNDKR